LVEADLGRERLGAWLFSGFGIVGLILGAGGVFGLIGHHVTSRRAEFGVRMALGASHGHVLGKAMRIGLEPALTGAGVGIIAAIVMARMFESFLLGGSG